MLYRLQQSLQPNERVLSLSGYPSASRPFYLIYLSISVYLYLFIYLSIYLLSVLYRTDLYILSTILTVSILSIYLFIDYRVYSSVHVILVVWGLVVDRVVHVIRACLWLDS